MLKLLGAALIIITTTWTGFEAARKLNERPQQLRQLKVALKSLEAEIMYGQVPLQEAFLHLSTQMSKPLSWFFESVARRMEKGEVSVKVAWNESLNEVWPLTSLIEGEKEVMRQFGETLGRHNLEQQQNQIRLTLTHMEREELTARDRQERYERMVKSLGVLSGLLIVILLM